MSDTNERSVASAGSVAGEPTTQAAFHRWQEFCKSCGFRLYDTPEAMSAFLEGIRCGRAEPLAESERRAVLAAAELAEETVEELDDGDCHASVLHYQRMADALRGLLERTK